VPGKAHAILRAEDVMLSTEALASSVRNQFRGRVVEIVSAGALSKVTIDVSGTPIVSAVTTRAVQELGLERGSEVVASFKATSVHIC
jgi:molybdopterin-binding protein